MQIRNGLESDLAQIIAIYNQAVEEGGCTADITPLSLAQGRDWFKQHDSNRYPLYVAEEQGHIWGWSSLSAHRPGREALQHVAEISYYVQRGHRGRGIGNRLVRHALAAAPGLGFHNLFAILLDCNAPSIGLLEKNGFAKWGHLPDIAEFPDRICGQYLYGRKV